MEENAIFVLFDLGRHFEEREDHSGGLGGSQCRMGQGVCTQGMVEDIGSARQQEPQGVGEKGRGPVTLEVTLDCLDIVFSISPCAVEIVIHLLGRRRR